MSPRPLPEHSRAYYERKIEELETEVHCLHLALDFASEQLRQLDGRLGRARHQMEAAETDLALHQASVNDLCVMVADQLEMLEALAGKEGASDA